MMSTPRPLFNINYISVHNMRGSYQTMSSMLAILPEPLSLQPHKLGVSPLLKASRD